MKLLIVSLLALLSVAAGVRLEWDANDPVEQVELYRIYMATNVSGPYIVSGSTTNTTITIEVPTPGRYFFYVTASNFWGESFPSSTVSTPANATGAQNLKVKKP
jgi:hypothetical protein